MEKRYRIVSISGSREWDNYQEFSLKMNDFCSKYGIPNIIIHGGARGVDSLADRWAKIRGIETVILRPNYLDQDKIREYGQKIWCKKAPLERNKDIASMGECLVAFPLEGATVGGTLSCIYHANQLGKPTFIHPVPSQLN